MLVKPKNLQILHHKHGSWSYREIIDHTIGDAQKVVDSGTLASVEPNPGR